MLGHKNICKMMDHDLSWQYEAIVTTYSRTVGVLQKETRKSNGYLLIVGKSWNINL